MVALMAVALLCGLGLTGQATDSVLSLWQNPAGDDSHAVDSDPGKPAKRRSVIERLDAPRRAMVLMALLGLVITGLFLVLATRLGGRYVRRILRSEPRAAASDPNPRRIFKKSNRAVDKPANAQVPNQPEGLA